MGIYFRRTAAIIAACCLFGSIFTSCDSDTLSPRLAKKALKKEAMFRDSSAVELFHTGFYEINESEGKQLAQLQAAGVVTFKTETIIEKKKKSTYDFWTGYRYYTIDVPHTFATVELTNEGKKYEVTRPVIYREDVEKDLRLHEKSEEEMPDYMAATMQKEAPDKEVKPAAADSVVVDTAATEIAEAVPAQTDREKPEKPDSPEIDQYELTIARVNRIPHNMLSGKWELVKVKEVFCPEEYAKTGKGSCKFIIEFTDKTPFGYVLGAPEQHKRTLLDASLTHYNDVGWVVDAISGGEGGI